MDQVNGSTTGGSPIHSDNPGPMQKSGQENGRVKATVTSHNTGNSTKGIEGSINNKGAAGRGSPFKK